MKRHGTFLHSPIVVSFPRMYYLQPCCGGEKTILRKYTLSPTPIDGQGILKCLCTAGWVWEPENWLHTHTRTHTYTHTHTHTHYGKWVMTGMESARCLSRHWYACVGSYPRWPGLSPQDTLLWLKCVKELWMMSFWKKAKGKEKRRENLPTYLLKVKGAPFLYLSFVVLEDLSARLGL